MKLDEWGAESIYYIMLGSGLVDPDEPADAIVFPLLAGTSVIRLGPKGCYLRTSAERVSVIVDPDQARGDYSMSLARALEANRKLTRFVQDYRAVPAVDPTRGYPTGL